MSRRIHSSAMDEEEGSEIDLTPMLDVVFIMLIFFIVTASFVRESGLDVNQPDKPQVETPPTDDNILVIIDSGSSIFMEGRRIDPRAVRANIERLHAEKPDGSVIIKADAESYNDTLIVVMDAARAAGVANVSMAD